MKTIIYALVIILTVASCSKSGFKVNGVIENLPLQKFWLEEMGAKSIVRVDSGVTNGNNIQIVGKNEEPTLYRIKFEKGKYLLLVLHKEDTEIKANWDNLDDYKVSGNTNSEVLKTFLGALRAHIKDVNSLDYVSKNLGSTTINRDSTLLQIQLDLKAMNKNFASYVKSFVDTTTSVPNAIFAANILNPMVELPYLNKFYAKLPSKFPKSKLAVVFKEAFEEKMKGIQMPN